MIVRIWHGWTSIENAEAYANLLRSEIFKEIESKQINGFKGIELLSRKLVSEVEFFTIMKFTNLEAVKEFAGEDYEMSVVPPKARKILSHYDDKAQHYTSLIQH